MRSFLYLLEQIEVNYFAMYDEIIQRDNILIDMDSALEPLTLAAFIEDWGIRLFDHAYIKCTITFKKGDDFSHLVVQQVIFR